MMHADLIDQDDFRERLQALGFSVPPDSTPEQACEYAVRGLSPERAQALRRLVEDMLGGHATLLPAVREAISRQLLPALVPAVGVIVTTTRLLAALASSLVPSTAGSLSPLPDAVTVQADRSATCPNRVWMARARRSDKSWLYASSAISSV